MFDRVMTDCDGVGIVVSVDYHGARYDVQTPRLLCKHLPAERVHLSLIHISEPTRPY